GGPPPRLLLEDPRSPLRGLPDAGVQVAARTQSALRHRRHGARLPIPERGGRRGRGGASHPRGRRRPSAGVAEGSRRRDRGRLHAPIWFSTYEYRTRSYTILLDAASGEVVRGDIPAPSGGFGEFLKGAGRDMFRA